MLPVGKLPHERLAEILRKYAKLNEHVVIGPRIGEDAAALSLKGEIIVVTTDPITFVSEDIGWYVVNVNANDVAVMGAKPMWFLLCLLIDEGSTDERIEGIFSQVREACDELSVSLIGGHTEITYGLDRPIAVGQMIGVVEGGKLISSSGAIPGDAIILTKGIPIEATSIISREMWDLLLERGYEEGMLERAKGFLKKPGISVVRDALIACKAGEVHAMHDPTEGGLATGIWELAIASGRGALVYEDKIKVFPESLALCKEFGIDPLGAISSGALLIAADPKDADRIIEALREEGIDCEKIGEITDEKGRIRIVRRTGIIEDLGKFDRDEIAKLF
jgi:hydrogenase maturation factor